MSIGWWRSCSIASPPDCASVTLVARAAQADPEELAHRLLVVDYEESSHASTMARAAAATEARAWHAWGRPRVSVPPRTAPAAGAWAIVAAWVGSRRGCC